LVPASDVESSSSPYSRSASLFLPSDDSTDTENSGDKGKVTKNLGKEMSDQPHVSKNTDKHGNKNEPVKLPQPQPRAHIHTDMSEHSESHSG
jgi:hypothetical protein